MDEENFKKWEELEKKLFQKQIEDAKTETYIRPIDYFQHIFFTEEMCYEAATVCVNRKMAEVRTYKPYKKDKTVEEIKEQLELEYKDGYSWVHRWIDDTRTHLVIIQLGRFSRIRHGDKEQIIEEMANRLEQSGIYIPLLNRFIFEPSKYIKDRRINSHYYYWEAKYFWNKPPVVNEEEVGEDEEET